MLRGNWAEVFRTTAQTELTIFAWALCVCAVGFGTCEHSQVTSLMGRIFMCGSRSQKNVRVCYTLQGFFLCILFIFYVALVSLFLWLTCDFCWLINWISGCRRGFRVPSQKWTESYFLSACSWVKLLLCFCWESWNAIPAQRLEMELHPLYHPNLSYINIDVEMIKHISNFQWFFNSIVHYFYLMNLFLMKLIKMLV